MIEIRGLVILDARILDYVTLSALAREGLLFEYTSVYSKLDHVISNVCFLNQMRAKMLSSQVYPPTESLLYSKEDCRTNFCAYS